MTHKNELLDIAKKHAYQRKKVILASGRESDFYIDVRKVSLRSDGAYFIAEGMWELMEQLGLTHCAVGGPTLGADPILSSLAYHAHTKGKQLNTFIVRKEAKEHGMKRVYEGPELTEGQDVILVDDVATTAGSVLKAHEKLADLKLNVRAIFVVVDRQEGGAENVAAKGLKLYSLLTKSDFGH
jgi:orotate phosphoribosyltransferase